MTSIATTASTINVPFHGASLFVVNHNGEPYTPMKPIVEGMGMDWKSQHVKLSQRFAKGMVEITIPTAGGPQAMICLALRKLAGWLNTISPNKVKLEIRDKVIQYQDECDDVLYEYWTKGEVRNKRKYERRVPVVDAKRFFSCFAAIETAWAQIHSDLLLIDPEMARYQAPYMETFFRIGRTYQEKTLRRLK